MGCCGIGVSLSLFNSMPPESVISYLLQFNSNRQRLVRFSSRASWRGLKIDDGTVVGCFGGLHLRCANDEGI